MQGKVNLFKKYWIIEKIYIYKMYKQFIKCDMDFPISFDAVLPIHLYYVIVHKSIFMGNMTEKRQVE